MAPLIYPEPTWSNRFGRVIRTLQIVAVAGAIGAVGGGVAVMSLAGGGSSSRPPTALKVSAAENTEPAAVHDAGAHPASAAPAVPQVDASAAATAAPAAAEASPQQSPAAAAPASNVAATEQQPVQEAAAPANSSAGTQVYNRVEPEQNAAPAHAPRPRAKATRHIKKAERSRQRGAPYPVEGSRYSDERGGPYAGERYSYRDYERPVGRGYYFGGGGGVFYNRGGWGD